MSSTVEKVTDAAKELVIGPIDTSLNLVKDTLAVFLAAYVVSKVLEGRNLTFHPTAKPLGEYDAAILTFKVLLQIGAIVYFSSWIGQYVPSMSPLKFGFGGSSTSLGNPNTASSMRMVWTFMLLFVLVGDGVGHDIKLLYDQVQYYVDSLFYMIKYH